MHDSKDHDITQNVNNKLASRGFRAPCRVTVQTTNGTVTLSGTVQYSHQKGTAVRAINGVAGVLRVVDRLIVKPAVKRQAVDNSAH